MTTAKESANDTDRTEWPELIMYWREDIYCKQFSTINFLLFSMMFVFQVHSTAAASVDESNVSRRASMQFSVCDLERPNSWATHRTLAIPESCFQGTAMEVAMANALCCVYTHVVVAASDGSTNQVPYLETYDRSIYAYNECTNMDDGGYTSVDLMEDVMSNVCGMSMGSRDCFDQAACIDEAKTTAPPVESLAIASSFPSPVSSEIPSDIPTPIIQDDDYTNATFGLSSFPHTSLSPSGTPSPYTQPSQNTNTSLSISMTLSLDENPPSSSIPTFCSPVIASLSFLSSFTVIYTSYFLV